MGAAPHAPQIRSADMAQRRVHLSRIAKNARRKQIQEFLTEDGPISQAGDHLKGVTGGAEGDESYASFFLLARSLRVQPTPRRRQLL